MIAAMTLFDGITLGVVQGVTEFLPISSDGHLRLAHDLLGVSGDGSLLFDLMLHLGTLVAVFLFYRQEIGVILRDLAPAVTEFPSRGWAAVNDREGARLALVTVVATVPTGIIGLLLKKVVSSEAIPMWGVSALLMVNGVVLWSSFFAKEREPQAAQGVGLAGVDYRGVTLPRAVLIGIAQGIAVLPGISRSCLTIVSSLWLGVKREDAARVSFLMSIPAILGAVVVEFASASPADRGALNAPVQAGVAVALVVGLGAIHLLTRVLRAAQFHRFAWYCWALGGASLAMYLASR
jgi:undecaprenyl-diphosphatase